MEAARWAVAGLLLAFWLLCFLLTLAVGVRWVRTGQTGSGLPLVGSVPAAGAILLLPVGEYSSRLAVCWVPLASEIALYGTLHLLGMAMGRRPPSGPSK